ncbi:hypothetical protein, partial [Methylosinus sp. R-45379]|uniref:hypothetical protein n=1 Tax=Methylosinus sp. R-45379 TaxID=980563 RepID=UPI0012ECC063
MAAVLYRRTPTDAFDEHFYRANYKDLVGFRTRRELRGHYNRHGRQEGRFPNLVEAIDYFERSYGTLPSQFDSRAYINAHEDLRALAFTDVQAIEHYLKWGRKEGRAYCAVSYDIYREFYFKGRIVPDQEVIRDLNDHGFAQSRICTGADIMSLKGLSGGGKWIEAIKIDEFSLLNSAWAGPVSTRMQAVDAMLEKGIELLAPVASALQFDPKFYKELHPELKHKSPEQCYCHWLFVGFERNEPGSAIQFFDELGLALVDFPSAFRWKRYIGLKRFFSDKHSRWSAIRDYVVDGFAKHVSSIAEGDDAGAFLNALGIYYLPINAALSVQAFERAVRMGVFEERNLESLAEAYLQLRKFECALERL